MCFLGLFLLSIALLQGQEQKKIEWKEQVIYFVLLDRFHNGSLENDFHTNTDDLYSFHGGDIQGLIQKLPYLKDLGITTIWLSPLFDNRDTKFFEYWAYHGYWVKDFFQVDEHFGNFETLDTFKKELQKHGMNLILDMVINHVDYNAPLLTQKPSWFHSSPDIEDWNDPLQVEQHRVHGLPDLAQENKEVEDFLVQIAKYWIDKLQPDGFRMDAVRHVPLSFWKNYNQTLREYAGKNFFLLGEFLDGNARTCSAILKEGKFTSLFDFPFHYVLQRVINGDTAEQMGVLFYHDFLYEDAGLLTTFLDNHDLDRFMTSVQGDVQKWKLALSLLFTVRGIPCIYYGTETGMEGGKEWSGEKGGNMQKKPENRRSMEFGKNPELFAYLKNWVHLRRSSPALSQGIQMHLSQSQNLYSFARIAPNQTAIVVFYNESKEKEISIPTGILTPYLKEGKIKDSTGVYEATIEKNFLRLSLPGKNCLVFFPEIEELKPLLEQWASLQKQPGTAPVVFEVTAENVEEIYLIGGNERLGNWNPQSAPGPMKKIAENRYQIQLELPRGSVMEYKYFQKKKDQVDWELKLENRYLQVPFTGESHIQDIWDKKQ